MVHRRTFAAQVHALGRDAAHATAIGWTGNGFSSMFNQHLVSLTEPLLRLGEQHLAFRSSTTFHEPAPGKAPACAVAVLDDILFLLHAGAAPRARPDPAAIEPLWSALEQVLDTLEGQFFPRVERERPAPPLSVLHRLGVPTVDEETRRSTPHECGCTPADDAPSGDSCTATDGVTTSRKPDGTGRGRARTHARPAAAGQLPVSARAREARSSTARAGTIMTVG